MIKYGQTLLSNRCQDTVTTQLMEITLITTPLQHSHAWTGSSPGLVCTVKYAFHHPVTLIRKNHLVQLWGANPGGATVKGRIGGITKHEKYWVTVRLNQENAGDMLCYVKIHAYLLAMPQAVRLRCMVQFCLSHAPKPGHLETAPSPFKTSGEVYWNRTVIS